MRKATSRNGSAPVAMSTPGTLEMLRAYESRNITFMEGDGSWPIVWDRAKGVHVWDAEGRRYLDLTAAFGVAAAGHANPNVVRAGQRQMGRLLHAMGDVHPHPLKARLARELSRITFERWLKGGTAKTIFCSSGFEAVEAALKTALLATGKRGVIGFKGGYHGLGYGALAVTHREHFRSRFREQLCQFGCWVPFPSRALKGAGGKGNSKGRGVSASGEPGPDLSLVQDQLRRLLRGGKIGAVLVEPVQVRGGVQVPPVEFLPMLRRLCSEHGALLILDEIYTGFGRTGRWFACERAAVTPDLICLGKALAGGFPLSACVGRAELMDAAWPESTGEAIHTSTFLGHPVGCAMALAQIHEIARRDLVRKSRESGRYLLEMLANIDSGRSGLELRARGLGLLAGVEVLTAAGLPATTEALAVVKSLLHGGFIFLPEGEHANVIGFTPPLTISRSQMARAGRALAAALSGFRFPRSEA
jgi:4-aminobutyrate aminotransferase-like enzyme